MPAPRSVLILLAVLAGAPAAAHAQAANAPPARNAAATAEPVGAYDLTFDVGGHQQTGTLVITRTDGRLTGNLNVHEQDMPLSVTRDGANLTLATTGPHGRMEMKLTFETENRLAGTFANQEMSGSLVAVRRRPPAR